MKVITAPRAGGKTTAMLEWMRGAPEGEWRVLVAYSEQEAMRLYRSVLTLPDNKLESWQFVGPDEARASGAWSGVLRGRGGRIVLGFDNLDLWLERQFPQPIVAVSMTVEP